MMRKLVTFLSLPPPESLLVVQLWARLLLAYLALRRWPLDRARRTLRGLPGLVPKDVSPERMARLTDIAARRALRPTHCLERCLALEGLLRRQGLSPELRIGTCRLEGGLRFHAWLEHAGSPIGEAPGMRTFFQPLDPMPAHEKEICA